MKRLVVTTGLLLPSIVFGQNSPVMPGQRTVSTFRPASPTPVKSNVPVQQVSGQQPPPELPQPKEVPPRMPDLPNSKDLLKDLRNDSELRRELLKMLPPREELDRKPIAPTPAPTVQGTPSSSQMKALALEDVLQSVQQHYPLLRAVEQERFIAQGRLISAMAPFDTNLRLFSNNATPAEFENYRLNLDLTQAFPNSGIRTFSSYRYGFGDFPVYAGGFKTAEGGEIKGGVTIPFLRDREIDRSRASLQQAQIGVAAAEPVIERQRLDFYRSASVLYWSWVAAGQRLRLAEQLYQLANDRDQQLAIQEKQFSLAGIDRIDNQQQIAFRGNLKVEAERAFVQASIDLSLFLRDESGNPILPTRDQLPYFPTPDKPDLNQFPQAIQLALNQRPELQRLRLLRQTLEVELRFSQNQRLPRVDGFVVGTNDLGQPGSTRTGSSRLDSRSLEAGIEVQLPLQFSDARGRINTTIAQINQIKEQERFTAELIRADIQKALTALERAYESHNQARQRISLARRVADIERIRFDRGTSNILFVTLREIAAFDAEVLEVAALFEYYRLFAEYKVALGITNP